MIQSFDWSKGVLSGYLKIAEAFQDIDVSRLVRIEPRTLFKITLSKKFISVIDENPEAVDVEIEEVIETVEVDWHCKSLYRHTHDYNG